MKLFYHYNLSKSIRKNFTDLFLWYIISIDIQYQKLFAMNYNLSFDFAGVFFLMLLLFILQKFYVINSKSSKYFREFLVISLAAGIFDIITALTIDYASHVPSVLNTILNTIYLFLASYATFSGARYIFSTVKFETKMP